MGRLAVDNPVGAGQDALTRGDWQQARGHFAAALEDGDSGVALEGLGWVGWWLSDEELTFGARERAYRFYRDRDDPAAAGRVAVCLAADFREYRDDVATGRGWLHRAHRLLDPLPETADHGWLALTDADFAFNVDRDIDATIELTGAAAALGRRLEVADLEAVGLALGGLARVRRGDLKPGMRHLEEAAAIATGEELELPLSSGWTMCCLVTACDSVGDFERASRWCDFMRELVDRWGGRQLLGVCRTTYGRILATRGDWQAAEGELTAAVSDFERSRPGLAAAGLVRLGELRARQGRTDEARALFERSGSAGLVGRGNLALDGGDPMSAVELAERVLRRLPPAAQLDRVPALELLARAQAALGEIEAAERTLAELTEATEAFPTPYIYGRTAGAVAGLAAARGDHDEARRAYEDAIDSFEGGSAPYDAALARLGLARTLTADGRRDQGKAEADAARDTFARLGSARDVERADELISGGAGAPRDARLGELTDRELEVLRLVAQGMSDAEIAERLIVSPHTVHRHVANVRVKLALPSRAAAVAYAAREGLL